MRPKKRFFTQLRGGMDPPLQGQSRSIAFGRGPPLQRQKLRFGRGPPLQGQKPRFGQGPPLQGDFVRRVVPRPAPTRGRGTSMYRSDEIPLQRRPSRSGAPRFGGALAHLTRALVGAQVAGHAIPANALWTASTMPRTFRWRKTRWCGDRAQAGHGWPALACWSHGRRNQAMRPIPALPRLPPKPKTPVL